MLRTGFGVTRLLATIGAYAEIMCAERLDLAPGSDDNDALFRAVLPGRFHVTTAPARIHILRCGFGMKR
jgi:hypothetical protein